MAQLLDGLAAAGITRASQRSREQILKNVSLVGPEAAAGVTGLIGDDALPPLRRARPGRPA